MLHEWLILAHWQPTSKEAICKQRYNISGFCMFTSFTCLLFIHFYLSCFSVCLHMFVFLLLGQIFLTLRERFFLKMGGKEQVLVKNALNWVTIHYSSADRLGRGTGGGGGDFCCVTTKLIRSTIRLCSILKIPLIIGSKFAIRETSDPHSIPSEIRVFGP